MPPDRVQITILIDEIVQHGLFAEHGFSLWIETGDSCILFDTGQGTAITHNARVLDMQLEKAAYLILSHGHYDHIGGVHHVLQQAPYTHVYAHPELMCTRYSLKEGIAKPIHIPPESRKALQAIPAKYLHWVQSPVTLTESIGITGSIPRKTDFEDTGGPFYLDACGADSDCITDDLAVWIHTEGGIVVCVGCAHAGLINTLNYIEKLNPDKRIRAVIGGFHLLNASRDRLEKTIEALQDRQLDRIIPCHCTGESAIRSLHNALGEQVSPAMAGITYRLP